jgi:hypothetical protein
MKNGEALLSMTWAAPTFLSNGIKRLWNILWRQYPFLRD